MNYLDGNDCQLYWNVLTFGLIGFFQAVNPKLSGTPFDLKRAPIDPRSLDRCRHAKIGE
jgi:uncharacterized membrane-anchored protein